MSQGFGQPIPDDPVTGTKVFDASGNVIGLQPQLLGADAGRLPYRSTAQPWKPYTPGMPRPADMAQTTTIDGKTVDFIVRWERGTINRFIYSIAMLAPIDTSASDLNRDAWNGR